MGRYLDLLTVAWMAGMMDVDSAELKVLMLVAAMGLLTVALLDDYLVDY